MPRTERVRSYWAQLLQRSGCDVVAFDIAPLASPPSAIAAVAAEAKAKAKAGAKANAKDGAAPRGAARGGKGRSGSPGIPANEYHAASASWCGAPSMAQRAVHSGELRIAQARAQNGAP